MYNFRDKVCEWIYMHVQFIMCSFYPISAKSSWMLFILSCATVNEKFFHWYCFQLIWFSKLCGILDHSSHLQTEACIQWIYWRPWVLFFVHHSVDLMGWNPSAFSLTAGDGSSGNKPFQLFVFCHAYADRHELQKELNMRHLILCMSMVGRLEIGSAGVVYKKSFLQQTWYGVMEQMRLDTWLDNGWLVLTILGLPWVQMRKKVPCNQKDRVGLVFLGCMKILDVIHNLLCLLMLCKCFSYFYISIFHVQSDYKR